MPARGRLEAGRPATDWTVPRSMGVVSNPITSGSSQSSARTASVSATVMSIRTKSGASWAISAAR